MMRSPFVHKNSEFCVPDEVSNGGLKAICLHGLADALRQPGQVAVPPQDLPHMPRNAAVAANSSYASLGRICAMVLLALGTIYPTF